MPSVQIPDIPDDVYRRLEDLARLHQRTVGEVAADILVKGFEAAADDEAELMNEIRADRERIAKRGVFIDDEDIRRGRDWGRS